MADNVTQKSPKSVDKNKYSNVIHRTTSETLRLGESEAVVNNSNNLSSTTRKKPCSSFQITSVIVGRMNNDGGDDSADDLDESHADDISDVVDNSRITDNETPSYSEDTYSKEDVFFNVSSSSLCSAPVIPTSSQYGLAIVPPGAGPAAPVSGSANNVASTAINNNLNTTTTTTNIPTTSSNNNVPPVVTNIGDLNNQSVVNNSSVLESGANDTVKLHEEPEKDMSNRFKVVKIETTEPFKRGRWMCMDYLDHTINQNPQLAQQHNVSAKGISVVQPIVQPNLVQSMPHQSVQQQPPGSYYTQQQSQSSVTHAQIQTSQQSQPVTQYQQTTFSTHQQHVQQTQSHVQQNQQHIQQPSVVQQSPPQQQVHVQQQQQAQPQQYVQQQVTLPQQTAQPQQYVQQQNQMQQQMPQQQAQVQQQVHVQQQQQTQLQQQVVQQQTMQQQSQAQMQSRVVQNQVPTSLGYNIMQQPPAQGVVPVVQNAQAQIIQGQMRTQGIVSSSSASVYSQPQQNYTPVSSAVIQQPQQYVNQQQQQQQQGHVVQQSQGQSYGSQLIYSQTISMPTQTQSMPTVQGQSYGGQPAIVPSQSQSYVGQMPQSSQGQSYSVSTASSSSNVPTQGQSYVGQSSQIVSNVHVQGQSYAGPPSSQSVTSFPTQAAQAQSYSQLPVVQQQTQNYISQQSQTTQQNQQQGQSQTFIAATQQTYQQQQAVAQQTSYNGTQVYTSMPQQQSYVVSMPSSPASVPQQPAYPNPTQSQSSASVQGQSQGYSQPTHLQQQQQIRVQQQVSQQQLPHHVQVSQTQQQVRVPQQQVPQQVPQQQTQTQQMQQQQQQRVQQVPSQPQVQQQVRVPQQVQQSVQQVQQRPPQPQQQRVPYPVQAQTPTYTQAQQPPSTVTSSQMQYKAATTHSEGPSPSDSKTLSSIEGIVDTPDDDNKTEETDSRPMIVQEKVSSFKITSIVYHHVSDDDETTDDTTDDEFFSKVNVNEQPYVSKFCFKCNQFISNTHRIFATRGTQTCAKVLYTVVSKNNHIIIKPAVDTKAKLDSGTKFIDSRTYYREIPSVIKKTKHDNVVPEEFDSATRIETILSPGKYKGICKSDSSTSINNDTYGTPTHSHTNVLYDESKLSKSNLYTFKTEQFKFSLPNVPNKSIAKVSSKYNVDNKVVETNKSINKQKSIPLCKPKIPKSSSSDNDIEPIILNIAYPYTLNINSPNELRIITTSQINISPSDKFHIISDEDEHGKKSITLVKKLNIVNTKQPTAGTSSNYSTDESQKNNNKIITSSQMIYQKNTMQIIAKTIPSSLSSSFPPSTIYTDSLINTKSDMNSTCDKNITIKSTPNIGSSIFSQIGIGHFNTFSSAPNITNLPIAILNTNNQNREKNISEGTIQNIPSKGDICELYKQSTSQLKITARNKKQNQATKDVCQSKLKNITKKNVSTNQNLPKLMKVTTDYTIMNKIKFDPSMMLPISNLLKSNSKKQKSRKDLRSIDSSVKASTSSTTDSYRNNTSSKTLSSISDISLEDTVTVLEQSQTDSSETITQGVTQTVNTSAEKSIMEINKQANDSFSYFQACPKPIVSLQGDKLCFTVSANNNCKTVSSNNNDPIFSTLIQSNAAVKNMGTLETGKHPFQHNISLNIDSNISTDYETTIRTISQAGVISNYEIVVHPLPSSNSNLATSATQTNNTTTTVLTCSAQTSPRFIVPPEKKEEICALCRQPVSTNITTTVSNVVTKSLITTQNTSNINDLNVTSKLQGKSTSVVKGADPLNAAGNSAVAIDNKIEQAMDLVKSHLMFAVREEVEVLKERIAELMDRINQLETENSILKTHASADTLALLAPQAQPQLPLPSVMPAVVSGAAVAAVAAVAASAGQVSQTQNKMSPGSAPGSL